MTLANDEKIRLSRKNEAIRKVLNIERISSDNPYTLPDLLIALADRIAALEAASAEMQTRLDRMERVVHRMERRL